MPTLCWHGRKRPGFQSCLCGNLSFSETGPVPPATAVPWLEGRDEEMGGGVGGLQTDTRAYGAPSCTHRVRWHPSAPAVRAWLLWDDDLGSSLPQKTRARVQLTLRARPVLRRTDLFEMLLCCVLPGLGPGDRWLLAWQSSLPKTRSWLRWTGGLLGRCALTLRSRAHVNIAQPAVLVFTGRRTGA